MSTVLIAEDEERIAKFIHKGLTAAGYNCLVTSKGIEAVALIMTGDIDLVILDKGLPDIDGFEVLNRVRGQGSKVPIIILTADNATASVVEGLEGGANDYMSKPFPFDELLARVKVRIGEAVSEHASQELGTLEHRELRLDLKTRTATSNGNPVELSSREFALAEEFFRHPGHILSREQLLSRVWGYGFDPGSNVVDVYVKYLRGKLGQDSIETVRGMGYRFK